MKPAGHTQLIQVENRRAGVDKKRFNTTLGGNIQFVLLWINNIIK